MKKVSLRDFQLKPTKYLNQLPIQLTRYGEPICQIHYVGPGVPDKETIEEVADDLVKEVTDDLAKTVERESFGICQGSNCLKSFKTKLVNGLCLDCR